MICACEGSRQNTRGRTRITWLRLSDAAARLSVRYLEKTQTRYQQRGKLL